MHLVCLTVQKSLEEQYFLRYWVDTEFAAVWSLASSVTAQSQHRSKTTKELEVFVSLFVFFIHLYVSWQIWNKLSEVDQDNVVFIGNPGKILEAGLL